VWLAQALLFGNQTAVPWGLSFTGTALLIKRPFDQATMLEFLGLRLSNWLEKWFRPKKTQRQDYALAPPVRHPQ